MVGEIKPLQVTTGHKLWSLDRGDWVQAGNLRAGERLASEDGAIVVASVVADGDSVAVYNLDIEHDHRFLVTTDGVLAHNAGPCDISVGKLDLSRIKRMKPSDTGIGLYDIKSGKVYMAPSSALSEGGGGHVDLFAELYGKEAAEEIATEGTHPSLRGFIVKLSSSTGKFELENNSSFNFGADPGDPSFEMAPRFFESLKSAILPLLNG